MITPIQRQKLCDLILEIGKQEMKIEAVRQLLCEYKQFTPYSAFKRLDLREVNEICASDIKQFLYENNSTTSITQCELFVKLYDKDNNRHLNYDEFLDAVLPQDNSRLRQNTLLKESSAIFPLQRLDNEVEFTLIKLIDWETKGVLELESEKYEFLGKISTNITKFLTDCFYQIDGERKGFFTNKQLESFFLHNSKVIYPEEVEAFFRRLSYGCNTDAIQENDFVIGLDFAPYKRNRDAQNRTRIQVPLLQQSGIESNSSSSKQNLTTANFGGKSLINGRSRIYSEDQQYSIKNKNDPQLTPTRTPAKGYYTQDFASKGLRSSSNFKTEPDSKLKSSRISTPGQRTDGYDILSYSNTSFKQNPSLSVSYATPHQVRASKLQEKDRVRAKEELEKQHLMKKLAITNKSNSKVDQIATKNANIISAKKVGKFTISNADTIESFYQPSAPNSDSKYPNSAIKNSNSANKYPTSAQKQNKQTPRKQRQNISPHQSQQQNNQSVRNRSSIPIQNQNKEIECQASEYDETKRQTLLQFKQEIRGQLANSKVLHQRSISPMKKTQRSTSIKQSTQTSFNTTATSKKTPSKNLRESSAYKLSQSYILIENDKNHQSPAKQVRQSSKQRIDPSMSQIMGFPKNQYSTIKQQDDYQQNNRSYLSSNRF